MKKAEAEAKYGVKAYAKWTLVPPHLKSRSYFLEHGVFIAKSTPPDAVKTTKVHDHPPV